MKSILHLSFIGLVLMIVSCDQVSDEVAVFDEISTKSERIHLNNEPVVVPIYGNFDHGNLQVQTSSGYTYPIVTDKGSNVTFLKYVPQSSDEVVDLQVVHGSRIVGTGTVQVTQVNPSSSVGNGSFVSKDYSMKVGDNRFSIDLLSEMSYNLEAPKAVEARVLAVRNARGDFPSGAFITTTKNESDTWDITLNYQTFCGGPGDGRKEFVIEVCLNPVSETGNVWLDPIKNCGTYSTALTSFTLK